ncbi:MAG: hypothetical protein JNK60_07575 [Acidobacteria bacterium]|nr:hypothetical protein [Acidobacteriota bacterium]
MITGFNTDIRHGDRVFHVQTEDRGIGNPVVESLVYVGGEILLSKKTPYKEHIKDGNQVDEKAVKEMMDLQHRRIIEAIRRGRFDGKKPGQLAGAPDEPAPLPSSGTSPVPNRDGREPQTVSPVSAAAAAAAAAILSSKSGGFPSLPRTTPALGSLPPSMRARTPNSLQAPGSERSLDMVIMDYLASEKANEHLELSLMTGGDLIAGEAVSITVRAYTSLTEKPVAGAHVSIRVVSTAGPPQVLYRGVTGNDGLVKATCSLPEIGQGSAALILAATSPLGNNEIKQLIKRK